jgi:uncharacterized DUF497 family protein
MRFKWGPEKDNENQKKRDVPFKVAQNAFADQERVIAGDADHGRDEKQYFCFGIVGGGVLNVTRGLRPSQSITA